MKNRNILKEKINNKYNKIKMRKIRNILKSKMPKLSKINNKYNKIIVMKIRNILK